VKWVITAAYRSTFKPFKKSLTGSINCLSAVEGIYLSYFKLKGTIPDAFSGLNKLTNLDLSDNALTGALPCSLCLLTGLLSLDLSNNHLSGEFPALPSSNLETLYISSNKFTGPIPTVFGHPRKLEKLVVDYNHFSVIPASVSQLSCLDDLSISGNPISSKIPSEIWTLKELRVLEMNSCGMVGSLAGMGALSNLQCLDVCNNQLGGTLPCHEIYSLQNLEDLHLSQNQFSGCVGRKLDIRGMPNLTTMCVDRGIRVKGSLGCHEDHNWIPHFGDDSGSDSEPESELYGDSASESTGSESETDSMED
ncbi:hypothetical protein HDU81_007368, partial [Chytriomyces hyalinus]